MLTLLAALAGAYALDTLLAEWFEARAYRRMNEAAPLMVANAIARRNS